ncbi:Coatomer subunit alpha-2, partial [Zancudomyces culisetae]
MNGDAGIIRTLETPLYVTAIRGAKVHCLDRDGMPRSIDVVTSDYMFKQALLKKDYRMVVDMIRKSSLVGQSIIAYLKHKGYPEVALHFVTDPAARFELAIECGNLDVALETARVIDRPQYWRTLADEALQLGRISTAELAYLRIKAYDKLAFIYLLAGLPDKLAKLSSSGVLSPNAHFQAALLLGDPKQRASLLADAGQLSLAYLTVKSHGIDDSSLTAKLSSSSSSSSALPDIPIPVASTPLTPPTPLFSNSQLDWPMLHISRGIFDSHLSAPEDDADIDASGWADDSLLTDHGAIDHTFATDRDLNLNLNQDQDQDQEPQLSGWGVDADLDGLGSDIAAKATAAAAADYV